MSRMFRTLLGPRGAASAAITLAISHTMFPSNLTDIELFVSILDPRLKTVANGGSVVNANHRRFATDLLGTSLLKYDIMTPTATTDSTGLLEGWFLLPAGSASIDSVVFLVYSDNGITTYQGDRPGMWARKGFVNHGSDDGVTAATNNYGTALGTVMTAVNGASGSTPGKLGIGALHLVQSSAQRLDRASGNNPDALTVFTVSAWAKPTLNGVQQEILGKGRLGTSGSFINYGILITSGASPKAMAIFTQGDGVYRTVSGVTTITSAVWSRFVGRYDGTNLKIFLNGVEDGTAPFSGGLDNQGDLQIGSIGYNDGDSFNGDIDEPWVDISNVDSADRILAQQRNQTDSSYITVS